MTSNSGTSIRVWDLPGHAQIGQDIGRYGDALTTAEVSDLGVHDPLEVLASRSTNGA